MLRISDWMFRLVLRGVRSETDRMVRHAVRELRFTISECERMPIRDQRKSEPSKN